MASRIVEGVLLVAAMLLAVPASADPDKDESGKGRHHGKREFKEEFWDGDCKVKRKSKDGEYKEERKCRAPRHAYTQSPSAPDPSIVITLPPIVIGPSRY